MQSATTRRPRAVLGWGLVAGAAGTTALTVVRSIDMAWQARAASDAPARTVDSLASTLGHGVPGVGDAREHRLDALGALGGTTVGLVVAVAASAARAGGLRLPAPLGALATGAAAMAASDVSRVALDISDPQTWTTQAWVSDIAPRLAYGVVTSAVLRASEPARRPGRPVRTGRHVRRRDSARLLLRSAMLGAAVGGRSSLALAGPVLSAPAGPRPWRRRTARVVAVAALGGELVADKLPSTPSRLEPPVLASRLVAGAAGAAALARREGAPSMLPALVGVATAGGACFAGVAWREWAGQHVPDWQAALVEDAVALTLATRACRHRPHVRRLP